MEEQDEQHVSREYRYTIPVRLTDHINNIETQAKELSQATEYAYLAMLANGECIGE